MTTPNMRLENWTFFLYFGSLMIKAVISTVKHLLLLIMIYKMKFISFMALKEQKTLPKAKNPDKLTLINTYFLEIKTINIVNKIESLNLYITFLFLSCNYSPTGPLIKNKIYPTTKINELWTRRMTLSPISLDRFCFPFNLKRSFF